MSARRARQLRAVSEATLAAEFCKVFGIPTQETLDAARLAVLEHSYMGFLVSPLHAYQWVVPLAAQVMSDKPTAELVVDVLMMPDTMFLVRDETNIAGTGLFLVWSGDSNPMESLPIRGLVNHFDCGGEMIKINAVQLKSCLR